jgi:hypothetical protein
MEIEILYGKMIVKVLNMLSVFKTFFFSRTHNMFALMFDSHFKGMYYIMDQIGRDVAITLMQQYDDLVWLPLLNSYCFGFFESRSTLILVPTTLEIHYIQLSCLD